jgi:membrane-associated HD superfamily phosphohydrolase
MAQIFTALQDGFSDRVSRAGFRSLLSTRSLSRTMQHAKELLDSTLAWGVVDMIAHTDETSAAGSIELAVQDGRLQSEIVAMRDVVTRNNAAAQAEARLLPAGTTESERRAMRILVDAFATENAFFDADAARQRREHARSEVAPVTEKLTRGEVIVRRGELVTDSTGETALADTRGRRRERIIGESLFLLLVFALPCSVHEDDPVTLRRATCCPPGPGLATLSLHRSSFGS